MFLLLVRKEIVHNVLSFRFVVTYALLFCLVLLAMFLMGNDYQVRFQEYSTAVKKARDHLDELDRIEDPTRFFNEFQGTRFLGFRSPRPLSLLARGLDGELPVEVDSQEWMRTLGAEERLGRNTLFRIFQTPDFAYVVNIVMSLLALLFVFDAVCGEKEQGTLKLLLSNPVPRDLVLMGKWIGGYLSVVVPFGVAVLGGAVYLYVAGIMQGGAEGWIRFGLIFLVSLAYISACFTLGLMISTLTHRSSTALLVSLLVWICWILVVPDIAPVAARLILPVPDRQVIESEKQAIDREAALMIEGLRKRKVYGDRQEEEKIRQDAERRKRKLEEFYQSRLERQVALTKNLARLSPSASFLFAATRLAGTGPELADWFRQARDRFQKTYQKKWRELGRMLFESGRLKWVDGRLQLEDKDWFRKDDLPRFQIFSESVIDSLDAALFDLLLLAVFNVLFFMVAFVAFLRYDVA